MEYDRLTLPEEFLLLGWEDQRGWNRHTGNLAMLLGGATILELVLEERMRLTDGRRASTEEEKPDPWLTPEPLKTWAPVCAAPGRWKNAT